ncbi:hypothetical protein EV182_001564 [Spiromyces aspiralis]|uniref:Uncharacterized protein n=1 Tax=Spiromyces aspiralis TaxID=68401 RepID=A0ACC1HWS1_9FUNG|nr:hypothetical protein EV182_001564 [Spiromyces aspiralis]
MQASLSSPSLYLEMHRNAPPEASDDDDDEDNDDNDDDNEVEDLRRFDFGEIAAFFLITFKKPSSSRVVGRGRLCSRSL